MEMGRLAQIVRRWLWLILATTVLTTGIIGWRLLRSEPIYQATVKLQLTAPLPSDVELYNQYRSSNLRDEMTVARNNFMELLRSREVYVRTARQLKLSARDDTYSLDVTPLRDSDFIYVTVGATSPELAEKIANAHVDVAINYLGEVRAKSTTASSGFLSNQLTTSEKGLRAAQEAVNDFEKQHNIGPLEDEIATSRNLIEKLQAERNQRLYDGRPLVPVDDVLDKQRAQLETLLALEPTYNVLQANLKRAQDEYQLLLSKYTEALLKEDTIQAASIMQIVEPAVAPEEAESSRPVTTLVLTLVGSLGLGVVLAVLLDGLVRRKPLAVVEEEGSGATAKANHNVSDGTANRARVVNSGWSK